MNTDDVLQQQELQKEFNNLVLQLTQQVSDTHLSVVDNRLNALNADIAHNLEQHALLLAEIGKSQPKALEDISKKYLSGLDSNLRKINENVAEKLDKHAKLLAEAGKNQPKALEDISKKYLSNLDNSLHNINHEIAQKLDKHSLDLEHINEKYPLLLEQVSQRHTALLQEVSANHLHALNHNLEQIKQQIPQKLQHNALALEKIQNDLDEQRLEYAIEMQESFAGNLHTHQQLLAVETKKILDQTNLRSQINNAELNELKKNVDKTLHRLYQDIETETAAIKKYIIMGMCFIGVFVTLPLAYLIYFMMMR